GVIEELLWMTVRGSTDVRELEAKNVNIWTPWKLEDGTIGPGYGKQFRDWNGIDQVEKLIDGIKTDPFSRRHIISLWNVSDLPSMALPPCHGLVIQMDVSNDGELSCQMYQRSVDTFIGSCFNIAFYSLFIHMVAQVCGLKAKEFVYLMGNVHIYFNHIDQVKE